MLPPSPFAFSLSQHQDLFQWRIGASASASASVLPMSIQDWFPLGWTGWISLQSKGLARVFSNTTVQKHQVFGNQPSLYPNFHIHTWLLEKPVALTRWIFVGEVMSLLFNMLSRFVIAFLPRSKHLFNLLAAVTVWSDFGAQENKLCHCFCFSPFICHEVMGLDAMIFVFWMLSFKPAFSLSSFTLIKRLFSSSSISAIRMVLSAYLRLFLPATLIPAWDSSSQAFHMMCSA